ncbi:LutC/YkgG family protein [Aestuariispira insulae]|uniref:L-lactate dehydrogenase complex protein LldG n=1 Tax=Aestuariispira insulae TaxID=1461337 RepID=A0A3D9HPG2_9PROT|nr:lactate utilization protein [Aestuariispira insulae]RED51377.1 L-lactate dehydrogenase complex protein LldG [Aestuariispira insulae]
MSGARGQILGSIRRSLGRGEVQGEVRSALEERLTKPKAGLIPKRSQLNGKGLVDLFCAMAEGVQASIDRVADMEAVPEAINRYLAGQNLPARIKMADHDLLNALPWDKVPSLTRLTGATAGDDQVSLSAAFAGIAETGTAMLLSGPDGPTTLNFLPETHMVVLPEEAIVGAYEEAWERLRQHQKDKGLDHLPRTVNLITGPSRTGDIEQTILLGAHGPHRLHIILVGDGKEKQG